MAIPVGKTKAELLRMANKLGVKVTPSGKDGKYMKEDYIIPIREYFLKQRYGSLDRIPKHMQLMLQIKSPMLALRMDKLKENQQKEIWESDKWYFEEKLNGARMLLIKDSSGIHIYSRHNSDVDLLPIEYTEKIRFPENFDLDKIKDDFILDLELTSDEHKLNTIVGKYGVVTETQLQAVTALLSSDVDRARYIQEKEDILLTFNWFDCIYYNGHWLFKEPLKKRKALGKKLYQDLLNAGFKIRPVRSNISNKKQFYKSIILSGGEGCVAKHIDSIYVPDTVRRKDGWIKIKRSMSQMGEFDDTFGDTIDGWISGFEPGTPGKGLENYVGTIYVSTYVLREDGTRYVHEIARISGFDMKLREDMTLIVDGEVTLKPSYYGRVVEIDGAGVSARNKRLNHAVLLGFRYDKSKDSCFIHEEVLNKMIL